MVSQGTYSFKKIIRVSLIYLKIVQEWHNRNSKRGKKKN